MLDIASIFTITIVHMRNSKWQLNVLLQNTISTTMWIVEIGVLPRSGTDQEQLQIAEILNKAKKAQELYFHRPGQQSSIYSALTNSCSTFGLMCIPTSESLNGFITKIIPKRKHCCWSMLVLLSSSQNVPCDIHQRLNTAVSYEKHIKKSSTHLVWSLECTTAVTSGSERLSCKQEE
jgi:hypothetical protein